MLAQPQELSCGKRTKRRGSSVVSRFLTPAAILSLLANSCMVGPNYKTPNAKVEDQYQGKSAGPDKPTHEPDAYWWKAFNDPILDGLIETAYTNNLSLQVAGVRVLGARAQLNQSIGNLFPQQQGLSSGLNYNRLNTSGKSFVPESVSSDYLMDQALFSASWEIDFWGKYRRTIQSDRATFLGTVASFDDSLVTLIADVATSYVNIRTTEERIRVAEKNLTAQQESLRVATTQYKYGETSELDMRQAETIVQQTAAQIPRLQSTLAQAKNGLAVLLGETPEEVDRHLVGPSRIPVAPADIAVGIPRDLLRRRPDVRSAGLSAASQCALIGVAKANMYPALSLSGAFGFASNNEGKNSLSDMFMWENRTAQAGASLVWPIFNYGRLVNQVRVQDAAFQEAVLNYQNTVLTAQQEVENGLSAFYTEQQALTNLTAAAASAGRSTELAMVQYKAGEADYTTVLSAEQSQLSVEDSVASSQGNVVLNLIAVYRALGGGWEMRGERDVISDEVKAEMARRTNWGRMLEMKYHLPKQSPVAGP
jgi:NodT family efflux transporter outer membrane factor (OMF) lipoprotein